MTNWGKFSRIVAEAKAAKKLDPVGEEDADLNNDNVVDGTDEYLKKRRATVGAAIAADRKNKAQSDCKEELIGNQEKIDANKNGKVDAGDFALLRAKKKKGIKTEEVEQIDEVLGGQSGDGYIGHPRLGIKNPLSGPKKPTTTAPQNTGLAGRLGNRASQMDAAMKELRQSYEPEGEQIHEIPFALAAPLVVGGVGLAANAIGKGMNKFVDKHRNSKPSDYSMSASKGNPLAGIAASRERLQQSYQPEGELVDEGKKELKQRNKNEMQRKAGNLGREVVSTPNTKKNAPKRDAAMNRMKKLVSVIARDDEEKRFKTIGQSPAHNEEFVGENKEHEREMRKAAARERAEERREKGDKAPRSPGREGPSVGKSYADYQEISIKAHDKITKKNKNPIGLVSKEEVEYIEEKGMSRDEMSSILKGHKYSKLQLLDMSKKSTKEGRHGEAAAFYDKFQEEYISEKSLSRAQQRFFGMVRAEQKGEMKDASPEVKEAAKSMKEKDVHDFASTKHKGLPEKKGDCKEEMSLVERILAEATDAERMAAKARREEREKKQSKRLRAAKLSVAANQVLKGEREDEPRTRESAGERVQRLKNERQEKMDAAKDKRQARADARKDAEEEKKKKEKEKEERNKKIEDAKNLKKRQRSELKSSIQSAFPSQLEVSSSEKDTDVASAMVGNIGRVAGGLAKTGFALGKYGVQRAMARRNQSKDKNEQFSNWREEFILEVDDQNLAANPKVIDVSKKKNKIEINPNMSEGSDCGGKDETPKKDMRDLRTKVNLAKTKARLMGDKNPIVMIAAEELETKNIQEIAPIVPLVARLLGGAASRSVATRIAGSSAQGSLRSMAGEIVGDKVGEIVQDRLTPKPKDKSEEDENSLDIGNRKVRNEGAAWTNKEGKNPSGGLNEKGRKSYERDNPGSDLKAPSKKVGNPRRKSFCARMKGMKAKLTSAKTARDPDSRINKSLRAWNC